MMHGQKNIKLWAFEVWKLRSDIKTVCCVYFVFVQNIALDFRLNPLNAELNPICQLLALLGAHPILHISRIRVKADLTLLL
jgi:hypothetical protein